MIIIIILSFSTQQAKCDPGSWRNLSRSLYIWSRNEQCSQWLGGFSLHGYFPKEACGRSAPAGQRAALWLDVWQTVINENTDLFTKKWTAVCRCHTSKFIELCNVKCITSSIRYTPEPAGISPWCTKLLSSSFPSVHIHVPFTQFALSASALLLIAPWSAQGHLLQLLGSRDNTPRHYFALKWMGWVKNGAKKTSTAQPFIFT